MLRTAAIHFTLLVGAVVIFFAIDACGPLRHAAPALPNDASDGQIPPLVHVLMTLTAVITLGWILGKLLRLIGQPPVIGEVAAGILLGPSLLGRVWPAGASFLLPDSAASFLGVIAQIGIILYMFLIGLEMNLGEFKGRAAATLTIAHASMAVPFVLGAALALVLFPRLASEDVSFTSFALFIGVALSITAFPVLARILTDLRMHKTPLGTLALACAASNDAAAWCLLALAVGVAKAQVGGGLFVIGGTFVYLAFMLLLVRPLAAHWLAQTGPAALTRGGLALVFVALLLSALTTEWIGLHAIFGAFVLGAVIPHDSVVARTLSGNFADFVTVLLLPAFFAFTGLRTEFGLVAGIEAWLLCASIMVVATFGKFGGVYLAARAVGIDWRQSSALGVLMNTRGLMELIVLNVGLELRIISPTLFAMMVLMALVTTLATTPILRLLGVTPNHDAHDEHGTA